MKNGDIVGQVELLRFAVIDPLFGGQRHPGAAFHGHIRLGKGHVEESGNLFLLGGGIGGDRKGPAVGIRAGKTRIDHLLSA